MEETGPICDVLQHTEQDYAVKLIGVDSYELLLGDLADYSSAAIWSVEGSYVLNDVKIYQGQPYKLIVAANQFNTTPNCSSEWTKQLKFNKACHNNMWTEGLLGKILAWVVYAEAVPFYPKVLEAAGFSGADPNFKENINTYRDQLYRNVQRMTKTFYKWNHDNECLPITDSCEIDPVSLNQNRTNRQIAWR